MPKPTASSDSAYWNPALVLPDHFQEETLAAMGGSKAELLTSPDVNLSIPGFSWTPGQSTPP